jgi:hypothetical protein
MDVSIFQCLTVVMSMKKILVYLLFFVLFILSIDNIEARSGCCSSHGGVCGCRCCDGTSLSAKCAPYYPSCTNNLITPTTTPTPIATPNTTSTTSTPISIPITTSTPKRIITPLLTSQPITPTSTSKPSPEFGISMTITLVLLSIYIRRKER